MAEKEEITIIPEPQEILLAQSSFIIDRKCLITVISSEDSYQDCQSSAELLQDELREVAKVDIPVKVKRSEAQNGCQVIFEPVQY